MLYAEEGPLPPPSLTALLEVVFLSTEELDYSSLAALPEAVVFLSTGELAYSSLTVLLGAVYLLTEE